MKYQSTLLLVAAILTFTSCDRSSGQHVTVAGSTSIQPFAEMLVEKFSELRPGVSVVVQGGGSTTGIQAVREGAAEIGMVSRGLHEEEQDLKPIVIARDGIAVIVHPSNALSDLTSEQVRDIFSGTIADFSQVGGPNGRIWPVTREEGSGTRGAFQELVMGKAAITRQALVQSSNGSMRELIASNPWAIGFISLGLVDESVKAVRVDGTMASRPNVRNGTYKLCRPFLFVVKSEPHGTAKEFIDFVLSDEGQRLLEEEGLVAAGPGSR